MLHKHISLLEGFVVFAAGLLTGFSLRDRIEAKTDHTLDIVGKSEMKPEDFFAEGEIKNNAYC